MTKVSQRHPCHPITTVANLSVTKNDGGQDSRQVTINVNNAQPKQSSVRINRSNVDRNMTFICDCITLEWRCIEGTE